jgi:transposase
VRAAHPGKRLRVFAQDEARIGQQGTLTRVWARTGSRPTAVRQTEYEWVYLWAAVEPATGASVAMITPTVDTGLMSRFLAGLSGTLAPDEHAVLVLDNAGWHTADALEVPANVTLLHLPPYSPELNPVERLWAWLRSHHLANRVYADYDELLRETDRAWLSLDEATIRSVCACPWIERAIQS